MEAMATAAALLARLRFALARHDLRVGDTVEVRLAQSYRARLTPRHLAYVPAGTRARVVGLGPMAGTAGGALIEVLDAAGMPSGYRSAAPIRELRRVAQQ